MAIGDPVLAIDSIAISLEENSRVMNFSGAICAAAFCTSATEA